MHPNQREIPTSPGPLQRQGERGMRVIKHKGLISTEVCHCLARGRAALRPRGSGASWAGGSAAPRALDPMPGKGGTRDREWGKGEAPRAQVSEKKGSSLPRKVSCAAPPGASALLKTHGLLRTWSLLLRVRRQSRPQRGKTMEQPFIGKNWRRFTEQHWGSN